MDHLSRSWSLTKNQIAAISKSTTTGYLRDATQEGSTVRASSARLPDLLDSFAEYKQSEDCALSSLELHEPFHPLCPTKQGLLRALTDGGRIGMDAPYVPRGCDMRWYEVDELCSILSRFEKVHVIGDSMMRNLAVGMHTLIRQDLMNGPHLASLPDPEGQDCHCAAPFGGTPCLFNSAYSSKLVWETDEGSPIKCPYESTAGIEFSTQLGYPLPFLGLADMARWLPEDPSTPPRKPHAFIFGHGLHNELNITATKLWLEQLQSTITPRMPYLEQDPHQFLRLFVTPSAAGINKPELYIATQGNPELIQFEKDMGDWLGNEGIDHLGTWNLTAQNTSPDGTHAGMRSNLVKAMMVFNWLDRLNESERVSMHKR